MTFLFFDGRLDIEISWDHGPELWITLYGRRTQIIMLSWNAYPVLGQINYQRPNFLVRLDRMVETFLPPRNGKSDPVMDEMMEEYGKPSPTVIATVDGKPYTIEDLYRDSPTDTPLLDMVKAMKEVANDPMNDPELQDKIRDAGRQVERQLFGRDAFGGDPGTSLHCAVCGEQIAPYQHDVDMCGQCHSQLKDLPPITYIHISDGNGTTRAFTFGTGTQSFVVVMSYATLGELERYEIGYALATEYRRATAKHSPTGMPYPEGRTA